MSNPQNATGTGLKRETFQNFLHDEFFVSHDGQVFGLQLVEVGDLPFSGGPADRGVRQNPFSLVFRSAVENQLPQGVYELDHPAMGATKMFLVPVDFGEWQAIFG